MNKFAYAFCGLMIFAAAAFADDIGSDVGPRPAVSQECDRQMAEIRREINSKNYQTDDNVGYPLISINTDSPLDMNWSAALELADPAMRPEGIVLPFLQDYPIENLEIKLRVLNVKF